VLQVQQGQSVRPVAVEFLYFPKTSVSKGTVNKVNVWSIGGDLWMLRWTFLVRGSDFGVGTNCLANFSDLARGPERVDFPKQIA
jgi:hypothetical protein